MEGKLTPRRPSRRDPRSWRRSVTSIPHPNRSARGRMGWQKASGYNYRALVEADISQSERVRTPQSGFRRSCRSARIGLCRTSSAPSARKRCCCQNRWTTTSARQSGALDRRVRRRAGPGGCWVRRVDAERRAARAMRRRPAEALHLRLPQPGPLQPSAGGRDPSQRRADLAEGQLTPDFKTIADFRRDNARLSARCSVSSCCCAGSWTCLAE